MQKFLLLGDPVDHSISPLVHSLFAQQFGLNIEYTKLCVAEQNVYAAILEFIKHGGRGLNITAPYKNLVYRLLPNTSERAKIAEAVNTVIVQDNNIVWGDNTDGEGLTRDLLNKNIKVSGKNILILGAGGAVRGILKGILDQKPAQVTLVCRDIIKAKSITALFANNTIHVLTLAEAINSIQDVIINALPLNTITNIVELNHLNYADTVCYDLNYTPHITPFMQLAHSKCARQTINGLGMLIEQAAVAFNLWLNRMPNTQIVLAQLQAKVQC